MPENKQIGIFWGAESIYCVESSGATPTKTTTISLPALAAIGSPVNRAETIGTHIADHPPRTHGWPGH
jgi:hypothetical protein